MIRFAYLVPATVTEAVAMLSDTPDAVPLAGGTDLLVQMKDGRRSVRALVSLKRLGDLHRLEVNGVLHIGAAVKVGSIAVHPHVRRRCGALADGAGMIGSIQIRNMATLGGNVCNASPSADTAPPLFVLNAEAVIAGPSGERTTPIAELYGGPGKTTLQQGELLKTIIVPTPAARSGSAYLRHTPRAWMDIAFVGVAASLTLDDAGRIASARIALGAVAPTPIRSPLAEQVLIGQTPDEALFSQAGEIAAKEARPIDDLRATADYRRHLINILTERALQRAFIQAGRDHA